MHAVPTVKDIQKSLQTMTTCYMHMKIQILTDSLAISLATPLCHVITYQNINYAPAV